MLVGTTSIENSELIAGMLEKVQLPHQVLNAKQHAREADIVAQAGRPKMITIATNMAGRGTDIVLGGNVENMSKTIEADESLDEAAKQAQIAKLKDEWQANHEAVKALGGLRIIATERHESRRIDNQLRGRSGRQGDPGSSRFFLSLDDSLMRIFAGDRVKAIMERLKMPEGEAIEAGMVTRSIESAQRKVEARNFDMRKQLLEYDDVSNDQRKVIYQQRNDILDAADLGRADQVAARRLRSPIWCANMCRWSPWKSSGISPGWKKRCLASGRLIWTCKPWSAMPVRSPMKIFWRKCLQRRTQPLTAKWSKWAQRTSPSLNAWCCCKAWTPIGAST